jgi:hypothetical protein
MTAYTREDIKIKNGENISVQTLNKSMLKLFSNITTGDYVSTAGTYATSAASGSIIFTDTISTTATNRAISPLTLYGNPPFLNTYFNDISTETSYQDASMKYIIVQNKIILMFGKLNTSSNSYNMNLSNLFLNTPYSLQSLYFISFASGELNHTISPAVVITSMSNSNVGIAASLNYSSPISGAATVRNMDWFAIGKIV